MKLAAKLVFFLVTVVIGMLAIEAFISVRRDVTIFDRDMRRDANQLGRTLKELAEDVWRANGRQRAADLIEDANDEETLVSVRLVRLDEAERDIAAPAVAIGGLENLSKGDTATLIQRDSSGRGFLYHYVPLNIDSENAVALEISKSLDGLDQFQRERIIRSGVMIIAFVVCGILIAGVLGVMLIGRPLNQLTEKTRRVGQGDLSGPVQLSGNDELAELAVALNDMCGQLADTRARLASETEARIAVIEQLRHADRLATVGRLAAGVAHELGTPLNVTSARASMIQANDDVQESASVIKSQMDRMTRIIRQLLDFAREHQLSRSSHDIGNLVSQVIDMLKMLARKQNVELSFKTDTEGLVAEVDGGQFQQVVTNLVENAMHAMPEGGRVKIHYDSVVQKRPSRPHERERDYVCLSVSDEGVGIATDLQNQIFDPFFTTKDVGEGTGLGLSIVFGIVTEHGGWIEVGSEPDQGSTFTVYFPRIVE